VKAWKEQGKSINAASEFNAFLAEQKKDNAAFVDDYENVSGD